MRAQMLIYASCPQAVGEIKQNRKKFEKRRKNFLTKGLRCASINRLTAQAVSTMYLVN